jgi:hypothetical protein
VSSWDDLRLQVTPGAGVVARSSAALLVVPVVAEQHHAVLEQLIALTRTARPGSGRVVARKLAGIVSSNEPEDVPDLALLAGLGGDLAVLVLGEVEVTAETSDGPVFLSGRDSLTWVDRVLRSPSRVVVGMPGEPEPVPMPHTDLMDGVVPGSGALLLARGTPVEAPAPAERATGLPVEVGPGRIDTSKPAAPVAPPVAPVPAPPVPAPAPAPAPAVAPDTGALTEAMPEVPDEPDEPLAPSDFQLEPLGDLEPEQRAPLPVEPEENPPSSDAAHTDLVEGVYCKRGHFTDPDSQFCIVCGIGLYETKIKRKGVRPELGFLVFDDGSVFHLDHDYVLGRQPEVDEEVKAGTVRGLRLDDSGGTVSRAHAIVRLIGWNVTIADRKSQNGTLVAAKGSEQFVPVSREQPITLVPGSRIQLGQRTLVYESQRGRS